jgi:hypothetical protein
MTFQPSLMYFSASLRPMPRVAPVMRTVLAEVTEAIVVLGFERERERE